MIIGRFGKHIEENYEIFEFGNASAILKFDYENEYNDLISTLEKFKLKNLN